MKQDKSDEELERLSVELVDANCLAGKCDGSCEEHIGKVKPVTVKGWGLFAYCDAAVEEDIRRGLTCYITTDT